MKQYLDLMRHIRDNGVTKTDRTGTGTKSIFGAQLRFDLKESFPLLTTKKLFLKGIIAELLWFLQGDTNANTLKDQGVHIWDEWAKEDGSLGPVYGAQWRNWQMVVEEEDTTFDALLNRHVLWCIENNPSFHVFTDSSKDIVDDDGVTVIGTICRKAYNADLPFYFVPSDINDVEKRNDNLVRAKQIIVKCINEGMANPPIMKYSVKGFDQISWLINRLKTQPDCRRMIVSAWNVGDLPKMALSPCHALFQFWTRELSLEERIVVARKQDVESGGFPWFNKTTGEWEAPTTVEQLDELNVPKYALSCQLYQRKHNCAFTA